MNSRERRLHRALPLLLVVALALVVGALVTARGGSQDSDKASEFVTRWSKGDYVGMYELLDASSRENIAFATFANAYREAAQTATTKRITPGNSHGSGDDVSVDLGIQTETFGTFDESLRLRFGGEGEKRGIAWESRIVFPALKAGEQLNSTLSPTTRGAVLTRNGTPLTDEALRSQLDTIFDSRLGGRPGGQLYAGGRVIARAQAVAGKNLRTTIDPTIQQVATATLAGRYGGIAVLRPTTGEVLALAGIATSAVQPPGSTFKIITVSAALKDDIVTEKSSFPVETDTTIEGVEIDNAHGEACGGTLVQSFAESCNSVFAPLGVKVGAKSLVEMAERFGFNGKPPFPGVLQSSIPKADEIGDDLAVGSSAIGQGQVQATTLQMASVAATIATRGRRHEPVLISGSGGKESEAIDEDIARKVEQLMLAAVRSGTGTSAAIPGVRVAGKTGTAELETAEDEEELDPVQPNTDAWFTAYAPSGSPRVAVAAMFVRAGAGGDIAAPAVREVLMAALK